METNTLLQTNLPYASFCSYHKPSEYVLNSKLKKKKNQCNYSLELNCKQHSVI